MREATSTERAELSAWLASFDRQVRGRDYAEAERLFDPAVVSFSSLRDVVVDRDELVEHQWKQVWPCIEGFRFDLGSMHVFISPDRRLAVTAVTWASTGFDRAGQSFARPGRATLVLARDDETTTWRGVHAHFSLNRGVPQETYAPPTSG